MDYHPIYLKHPPIRDLSTGTSLIPLFDRDGIVDWTKINTSDEPIVLPFRYHRVQCDRGGKLLYYAVSTGPGRLHNIIMGEKREGFVVDHRDNNGLNNTRDNLRHATYSQNSQNKGKTDGCTSKYIGVYLNQWKKYVVRIASATGIYTYLGLYENELFAATVYDCYAIKIYGIDAKTNNTLTDEIKEWIIVNDDIPEEYKKKEKPKRDLPDNISLIDGKYRFRTQRDGVCVQRYASTLEAIIKIKEKFLREENMRLQMAEEERLRNPTKNSQGQYIIKIIQPDKTIEVIVDEETWPELSKYSWCENDGGYYVAMINKRHVSMHRYIYEKYVLNSEIPKDLTVDHKNSSDKFDNRQSNLRLADRTLQAHNRNVYSTNPLNVFKGIEVKGGSFVVRIDSTHYGSYKTEEEAAEKANGVFIQKYGENAHLNVVDKTKRTTVDDKIRDNEITKEYVEKIVTCEHLKEIVKKKGLNERAGGPIILSKIRRANLEETKQKVIETLFPNQS